jgi:methoxymalonate biosynthesis protein
MIKCVVWDIDNTLLSGTYLESGGQPPAPDQELLAVARELDRRGIVHALASKNPPEAADYVAAVTHLPFAAAECGWGRKSEAVRRIIGELGITADAVAFVDDDLMERAEVAAGLPEVLVLSPEDAAEAPGWPAFSPAVITDEGRRRGQLYAQRRLRQEEARAFGGSRDDFLRYAGTRVLIAPAGPADLPRLHELSVRTHQFTTAGEPVSQDALAGWLGSARHRLVTARLRDRFGDDGLVGGALADQGEPARGPGAAGPGDGSGGRSWTVPLLVMSCRAMGRGVLDALLAALGQQAAAAGAAELRVLCLVTARNVPLRLALAAAGLRPAGGAPPPGEPALFTRLLAGPPPELPDWVEVTWPHGTGPDPAGRP